MEYYIEFKAKKEVPKSDVVKAISVGTVRAFVATGRITKPCRKLLEEAGIKWRTIYQ